MFIQLLLKLVSSKFAKIAGLVIFIFVMFMVRIIVFPRSPLIYWIIFAVLVIIVYIVWILISNKRSKKKDKAISDSLVEDARKDEANARPDRREVYRRTRENLEYTIHLLEKSRPKDSKGTSLYRLPWIMVVGPPSDGKTTAIKNAGIRWPQDPRLDEAGESRSADGGVGGSGGTRSCNWFFSTDAIILDTAGRWQARDQGDVDEEEWLQFLGMLQKFRPKRPINGVIALCSIERVLEGREEAKTWARKIRRQINEIMEHLGAHVPVYMVFNKCDLIHGFVEYFQDLNEEGRKQIWGFTRTYKPLLRKSGDGLESERDSILNDLANNFDQLVDVLEQRRRYRLSDPTLFPSERAALCIFPSEFKEVREPIKRFVADVFYENPYGHNPMLRGIYFTSATQFEGNPIVQLMKQVAGEYDIPLEALPFSAKQMVDSYFLNDLMKDVIFQDNRLGGRFKKSLYDKSRLWLAGGVAALTLLIGIWISISFAINSGKNDEVYELAERVKKLSLQDTSPEVLLTRLDSLRVGLKDYASTGSWYGPGIFSWLLGAHEYGDLTKAGRSLLARRMESTFIVDAWQNASSIVKKNWVRSLTEHIASLKTYIYLSRADGASRIGPGIVSDYILRMKFAQVRDPREREKYGEMLSNLLEYYTEYSTGGNFQSDSAYIKYAGERIQMKWDWAELLEDMLATANYPDYDFPHESLSPIKIKDKVRGAYTYTAWNEFVKDSLKLFYEDILGDSIMKAILGNKLGSGEANPLSKPYYNACKRQWAQFFREIKYDVGGSKEFWSGLLGFPPPLVTLLKTAAEETAFRETELKNHFAGLLAFTGTKISMAPVDVPVESSEEPTGSPPMDAYVESVREAAAAIDELSEVENECSGAYRKASGKIRKSRSEADLGFFSSGRLGGLGEFLKKPFQIASGQAAGMTKRCLNNNWQAKVFDYFKHSLDAKYPFYKDAELDASFAEVKEFLSFDGRLGSFRSEEIESAQNAGMKMSQNYQRSYEMGKSIYDKISGNAQIELVFSADLAPEELRRLWVEVDGYRVFSYANGPDERLKLDIPTEGVLTIHVELNNNDYVERPLEFGGEWAALRLLDKADASSGIGVLKFRGRSESYSVRFRVASGTGKNSLLSRFRDYQLPKNICR